MESKLYFLFKTNRFQFTPSRSSVEIDLMGSRSSAARINKGDNDTARRFLTNSPPGNKHINIYNATCTN